MAVKSRSKSSGSKRTIHRTGSVRSRSAPSKSKTSRSRTSAKPAGRTVRPRSASSRSTAASRTRSAAARTTGAPRSKRESHITTDHEEIRQWAEERGAQPACVKGTGRGKGDVGMIRLDFPGYSGEESLEPISWEEWFDSFEENNLALVYEDTMASGKKSNFNKIVSRERDQATRL